jgi:hypothetical protein
VLFTVNTSSYHWNECRLFFDKSNKRSINLETAVTWSKSNLNMMNIYEESTINFWIWLIFCFLNVLILSALRLHKLSKLPYVTINFTVISVLQSSVKSIGKCKKKSPHNQPKQYLFLLIYSLCCYEWFLFVHNLTQQIKIDFDFPIYFN